MRQGDGAERGFTLIEVLVGVLLLAMLATVIATGTHFSGRAWNAAERQTGEVHDMEAVETLLRRTIAQAHPAFATADPADLTIAFSGDEHSLTLVASQPGTLGSGPWVRQHFYLGPSGKTRALFLSWRPDAPASGAGQAAESAGTMVLDHIGALRFAYFGQPGPGEAAMWLEQWAGRDRLPELVRVTIERDSAAFRKWPQFVIATRIGANAGCIEDAVRGGCRRIP